MTIQAYSQNYTVEAIIGEDVYNISDSIPFQVLLLDNLGPAEATRYTERGPDQDGDTDIDYALQPRIIPVVLQAISSPDYPYEDNRARVTEIFKATTVPIILRITSPSGKVRQIDTQSLGDIGLPLSITELAMLRVALKLRAANPTFYDPDGLTYTFAIPSGGFNSFLVPSYVPTFIGSSVINVIKPIKYTGTYREYPVFTIYGPVTDLVITNLSTQEKISFQGYSISAGDYYTIDLRYGRKLVYKNGVVTDNRISETTETSNLATFALQPKPFTYAGINSIQVTGSGGSGVTRLVMQYNNRYDGI